jgi:hypothetical protein
MCYCMPPMGTAPVASLPCCWPFGYRTDFFSLGKACTCWHVNSVWSACSVQGGYLGNVPCSFQPHTVPPHAHLLFVRASCYFQPSVCKDHLLFVRASCYFQPHTVPLHVHLLFVRASCCPRTLKALALSFWRLCSLQSGVTL